MENIFIGWGGNQKLAYEVEKLFDGQGYNGILGGGSPTDMHVGAQVLSQIDKCTGAILLFEDKDGRLRENLLYELGYIVARMSFKNVHIFMIDKSLSALPSDLLGIWATEVTRKGKTDEELAAEIYRSFEEKHVRENRKSYFDLINEWPSIRQTFADLKTSVSERQIAEYAVLGCLAAYYYGDIKFLNKCIDKIQGSDALEMILQFAETYNDVFINSNNMSAPIDITFFSRAMDIFERTLQRKTDKSDNFQLIIDMLCYDVFGLACVLYMKNEDAEEKDYCREKARECFLKTLELSDELEKALPDDPCLIWLIRAYIYNDTAHLYLNHYGNEQEFLKYLDLSVTARQSLYFGFHARYPENTFLETKLEQEYLIALSEQCLYLKDVFKRKVALSTIQRRHREWREEVTHTFSLINRLEANMKKLGIL